ncbi:MAG: hypothetical protein U0936_14935 [Planctomycetaceae bacterium]
MDTNPYEVTSGEAEIRLTARHKLTAMVVGGVVAISSAVTMAAFLFGLLVAFGGKSMPAPVNLTEVWAGSMGPVFGLIAFTIIPIAIALGIYISIRLLRMQRILLEAKFRRLDLNRQVEEIKQSLDR